MTKDVKQLMQGRELSDPLKPSLALLAKLGSIIVHADEYHSSRGHDYDYTAFKGLLADPEVITWIKAMGPFLPVKR